MDIAYCIKNDRVYDIATFCNLKESEIDFLRYSLVCHECKENAYYRKKSINGVPAFFGAYHKDDCIYKSNESSPRYDSEVIKEVNTIQTSQSVIDVNFTQYTKKQLESVNGRKPSGQIVSLSGSSVTHVKKPIKKRNASKGLRTLLRMLMKTDTFADSNIKIKMFGNYEYYAKNLFVNFDDITKSHLKQKIRGYWGMINNSDSSITWLNTRTELQVSIPVGNIVERLKLIFNISHSDDLQGAMVLVFGELQVSKNDKWYIRIKDDSPSSIFIKLVK